MKDFRSPEETSTLVRKSTQALIIESSVSLESETVALGHHSCVERETPCAILNALASAVQWHGTFDRSAAFRRLSQQRYFALAGAMCERLL